MHEHVCMTFIQARPYKELGTVQLSESPIPRVGEEVKFPTGVGIDVTAFKVAKVSYHYSPGRSDYVWNLKVTVLLAGA
jgi:hypothetical protein